MYIRWFKDLTIKEIPSVGGKNASLGEMYSKLTQKGVPVPNGFALTADAYWAFIRGTGLDKQIKLILKGLDVKNVRALSKAGTLVRDSILKAEFPKDVADEVLAAYKELSKEKVVSGKPQYAVDVAVRSSATAEDLPDASFAGQQESYLNVKGESELLVAVKKCIASLFTDRAIFYREAKGFDHLAVALSVGVQAMVRSDMAASGVMFTLDTESGFTGVVLINAAYGLGEYVVKGRVNPDQYFVFKEGVKTGHAAIIDRRIGTKEVRLVYGASGTRQEKVKISDQKKYCLTDEEVVALSKWGIQIEEHYGHPMDIEWAKDGVTGKLFIVQARSETVKSRDSKTVIETYKLGHRGKVLLEGVSVGQRIGQGKVHIITSPKQMKQFKPGEVLVTRITDPDWVPVMKIASAIITEQGGKTSHAAIVSRELGIPCIVGAPKARHILKPGKEVTVSCAEGEVGYVYDGRLPFEVEQTEIKDIAATRTKIMMNVGDPAFAFSLASIPNQGIGLAREEFIFTNFIKIHPLALVHYKDIKDKAVKAQIDALTIGYKDKTQYLIDKLAQGIAFIAASSYPNDVILRFSDFKTNEYATLIGGAEYEPKEENPMIGWRGASRYYDETFKPAFKLECEAIKKVRETWGLKNVIVMVPFCRTVEEGQKVLNTMKEFGLERGKNGLQVYVMCEIPSNVILAKEFCQIFDGFSIGSNDLTQLTLGVDRDSALVHHIYNENNAAVKELIRTVIRVAHENKRKVGICGQAPSDYPEFAEFLVQEGIDSISLNPDTVIKTRQRIAEMEKKLGAKAESKVKLPLATKALTMLGIAGLFFMLAGYTCQTVNNQAMEDNLRSEMMAQVQKAKVELREEFKREKEAERTTYSENGFAKFTLQYPSSWPVKHTAQQVDFGSQEIIDGKWFWFRVSADEEQGFAVKEKGMTTTTFFGYDGWRVRRVDEGLAASGYDVLYIKLPNGYNRKYKFIQFAGDTTYFDEILKSIKDFELKK